ncbi:MAG: hypothetical protein KKA79_01585 [Nanoarchaeota archaeon]|nr:hypothetical protein [Nanoarchaeota archaeon]
MVKVKVVFVDGEKIRAVKGEIVFEDADFIALKRQNGIMRLSKKWIRKIEPWAGDANDE